VSLRDLQDIRDGLPDAPTWDLFRDMGSANSLSAEGIVATRWALGLFEDTFGRSWPIRQFRQQGWVPGFLLGYASHRSELPRLLAVACQLDQFRDSPTLRPVLTQVKNTVTNSGWRHLLLQLEVARAGDAVGASVRFEPPIQGSQRSGDVELTWAGQLVTVETTSLSRADADIAHERFESGLWQSLQELAAAHIVAMEVSLSEHPIEDLDPSWLEGIDSAAATVALTGARLTLARGWARLVITPASHLGDPAPGVTTFTGAVHQRDIWYRIRDVLRDKARQSVGAPNVWIRMDALDGLFALTEWARSDTSNRAAVIADAISTALADTNHVQGVILSSGASVNLDNPSEPLLHQRADTESAVMLRRLIAPGLLRETAIITLNRRAGPATALFARAYDTEGRRFDKDLAQRGWSLASMRAEARGG
jgi:hypothetical protein